MHVEMLYRIYIIYSIFFKVVKVFLSLWRGFDDGLHAQLKVAACVSDVRQSDGAAGS